MEAARGTPRRAEKRGDDLDEFWLAQPALFSCRTCALDSASLKRCHRGVGNEGIVRCKYYRESSWQICWTDLSRKSEADFRIRRALLSQRRLSAGRGRLRGRNRSRFSGRGGVGGVFAPRDRQRYRLFIRICGT